MNMNALSEVLADATDDLRGLRAALLSHMLADVRGTYEQMVAAGILEAPQDWAAAEDELRQALQAHGEELDQQATKADLNVSEVGLLTQMLAQTSDE